MMKTKIFSSLLAVLLLNLCFTKAFAQDDKVYNHIALKNPPTYPGGIQKFYEFFAANMKYPNLAVENNVQGTLYVNFIIEKDGSLTDVKLEGRKLGYGTEDEAIRVLKLSKKWNPGTLDDKPVRVKYNIPVRFRIPTKNPNSTTAMSKPEPVRVEPNAVYDHVSMENPPSYPGGIAKFYEFLGKNISYPKAAAEAKVRGTVYVSYTIETDGSLTDIKVQGPKLGAGLDEEAIRVVKLSKKWNPGRINGVPARVKYNIPIKFTM